MTKTHQLPTSNLERLDISIQIGSYINKEYPIAIALKKHFEEEIIKDDIIGDNPFTANIVTPGNNKMSGSFTVHFKGINHLQMRQILIGRKWEKENSFTLYHLLRLESKVRRAISYAQGEPACDEGFCNVAFGNKYYYTTISINSSEN